MDIKVFAFNPFQVNTYVLYTETGEALVIDPGMSNPLEEAAFSSFVTNNGLRVVGVINTHGHVDHIVGNDYVRQAFGVPLLAHESTWKFLQQAPEHGAMYGFRISAQQVPDRYLTHGEVITLGGEQLRVMYAPGHADGSICLYHSESGSLFCGDVLFNGSIGRTDLPTGDMDVLLASIREQIMVLPQDTWVYPGHGPRTSVGFEQQTNPFLS